jgi:hypothetical protein
MASFVIPKAGIVDAEVLAASAIVVSLPEAPETYTAFPAAMVDPVMFFAVNWSSVALPTLPAAMVDPVMFFAVNWSSVALPTLMPLDRLAKLIFFVSLAESSTMTRTSALSTEVNSESSDIFVFAISFLDIVGEFLFGRHQYLIP